MNKIVIVTGATSGIGKAIAEKFILTGDKVIAIGRNKEKLANLEKQYPDINSIAPGFIENTGFTSVYPTERVQQIVSSIPMNRAGNVNDIAETCFFLCSDNASYITGEIIKVNGGWLFGR